MRILIAEDDADLNRILVKQFTAQGYTADSCANGTDALDYILFTDYDAVVMDIMMPGADGLEVLSRMRAGGVKTPVLLLTARDGVDDRIQGLDAGADDYLVKPFSFGELLARVRVLTRRRVDNATNIFALGDLVMDTARRRVSRGGREIGLSAREFAVLEYMIRNQGIVLTREAIEQHVWGYGYEGGSNVVDVYIRYLRRKIDAGHPEKLLHTVRGAGYVLRLEK